MLLVLQLSALFSVMTADSTTTITPFGPVRDQPKTSDHDSSNVSSVLLPNNSANSSGNLRNSSKTSGLGIAGGRVAYISDHPYIVSVIRNSETYCSASIINARYALTSAHCGSVVKKNTQSVFSGSSTRGSGTAHTITDIIMHEDYNPDGWRYNIGLLRVDPPFDESRAIELSRSNSDTADGKWAVVSGWGRIAPETSTDQLHEIDMQVIGKVKCLSILRKADGYGEFCAGDLNKGKGICKEDSGDPFVVTNDSGKRVLAGLMSWRILTHPCEGVYPDVYTRVNDHIVWIERNVKP